MVESTPENDADAELARRVSEGDVAAFGVLVEQHMHRAYYAALGLVGSPENALDLSQEAFARAFRARRTFDPTRPFYPWLYQILRRLCFNFVRDRRTRRERTREAADWLVAQAEARVGVGDPARQLEMREDARRLAAAIEHLPDRCREVLVLREFEGLRYREIAELLGVPIGTVMSRLYDARRMLAESIREDGE